MVIEAAEAVRKVGNPTFPRCKPKPPDQSGVRGTAPEASLPGLMCKFSAYLGITESFCQLHRANIRPQQIKKIYFYINSVVGMK